MNSKSRPFASRYRRRLRLAVGFLTTLMLLASPSLACSVCYGEAKDSMIDGGQNAIVFMLLLTYLLLGGGAFLMITMRRRIAHPTRGTHG